MKLPTPGSEATYKGTLAHHAFERIFDFPREERTPENAVPYVRAAWNAISNPLIDREDVAEGTPEYIMREELGAWKALHKKDSKAEQRLIESSQDALNIVKNPDELIEAAQDVVRAWFSMEVPSKFDPFEREYHAEAKIGEANFHGFIDRLDRITDREGVYRYFVSDYKTGAKPKPAYEEEAFFQLDIYAALLKEKLGVDVYQLRLLYVREGKKEAILTRRVTPQRLERTRRKISNVWADIHKAAEEEIWPTRKQVLCGWCHFKPVCPAWDPSFEGASREEIMKKLGDA